MKITRLRELLKLRGRCYCFLINFTLGVTISRVIFRDYKQLRTLPWLSYLYSPPHNKSNECINSKWKKYPLFSTYGTPTWVNIFHFNWACLEGIALFELNNQSMQTLHFKKLLTLTPEHCYSLSYGSVYFLHCTYVYLYLPVSDSRPHGHETSRFDLLP